MTRLAGKVAFITGAAAGIGRAAALLFAANGARVAVADIATEAGERTAAEIREAGGAAMFVKTDVADEASVRHSVDATVGAFGKIDVLYNNAGGSSGRDGKVTELPIEELWRTLRIDLVGTFLCCRYIIPEMRKAGGGAIVNTASITALRGVANVEAYSAAKGGVVALSQSMAVNHAADNIRVNALAPAGIVTERTAGLIAARKAGGGTWASGPAAGYLLGMGTPMDVANVALFLASDEARYLTGLLIPVDGGLCALSPRSGLPG
jgi:NAD(P)-dependent dehydrogenase (short-subunit alcohol dehydrogenase family)